MTKIISGTYQAPLKTLPYVVWNKMKAGDTVYAMDGVVQKTLDNYDATLDLHVNGSNLF